MSTPDQRMAKISEWPNSKWMAKFLSFQKHSLNRQNSNRRMASQNFTLSYSRRLLRTAPDPIWTWPNNPKLKNPNRRMAIFKNWPLTSNLANRWSGPFHDDIMVGNLREWKNEDQCWKGLSLRTLLYFFEIIK